MKPSVQTTTVTQTKAPVLLKALLLTMLNMLSVLSVIAFGSMQPQAFGQTTAGVSGPEQDCINALPVVQTVMTHPLPYLGIGSSINEISPQVGTFPSGERNGIWYRVDAQADGLLGFAITPNVEADNYDWVVYRLGNIGTSTTDLVQQCFNIRTMAMLQIAVNTSPIPGRTAATQDTANQIVRPVSPRIRVERGVTYMVYVANITGNGGFRIDFSETDRNIIQTVTQPQARITVAPVQTSGAMGCNAVSTINVTFSERILCASVTNGTFTVSGPGGPYTVTNVLSQQCIPQPGIVTNTMGQTFTLTVSPALSQTGAYTVALATAPESVRARDRATNPVATPQSVTFSLTVGNAPASISPRTRQSECLGRSITLTTDSIAGNTRYEWFSSTNPTVPITGQNGFRLQVNSTYAGERGLNPALFYQSINQGPINYFVRITDQNGCSRTSASVTVEFTAAEVGRITGRQRVCPTNPITLAAPVVAGVTGYRWTKDGVAIEGPRGAGPVLMGVNEAGVYRVELFLANGCKNVTPADTSAVVETFPVSGVVIEGPNAICDGGQVTLSLRGSLANLRSAQWSDASGMMLGSGSSIMVSRPGTYTLRVITNDGCVEQSQRVLIQSQTLRINDAQVTPRMIPFCEGDVGAQLEVRLNFISRPDGSAAQASDIAGYQWYRNGNVIVGATQATFRAVEPGRYQFQVINRDGCASVLSPEITVQRLANPPVNIRTSNGLLVFCRGERLTLNAGSGYTSYNWQRLEGGQFGRSLGTDSTIVITEGGTYRVSVTAESGCASATSATITQVDNPTITIRTDGNRTSFCQGGSLGLEAASDIRFSAYEWRRAGSTTIIGMQPRLVVNEPGSYCLTVKVGECSSPQACVNITVDPLPTVPPITSNTGGFDICPGNTLILDAGAAPAGQTWTYQWLSGGQPIQGATNRTFTVMTAGTYNVTVTNTQGCQNRAPSDVTVRQLPAPPQPVVRDTLICTNDGTTQAIVPVLNFEANRDQFRTFEWAAEEGTTSIFRMLTPNAAGPLVNLAANGTATFNRPGRYRLTVRNASSCATASNTVVVSTASLTVRIERRNFGATFAVLSNPPSRPGSFQWFRNGMPIPPPEGTRDTLNPQENGVYDVQITNVIGCPIRASEITRGGGGTVSFTTPTISIIGVPSGSPTVIVTGNSITAAPGDSVGVRIIITAFGSIEPGAPVTSVLKFNATLLEPLFNTTEQGTDRVRRDSTFVREIQRRYALPAAVGQPLRGSGAGGSVITADLPFRAALGNTSGTLIRLDSTRIAGVLNLGNTVVGEFRLTNLSFAGGIRLINALPRVSEVTLPEHRPRTVVAALQDGSAAATTPNNTATLLPSLALASYPNPTSSEMTLEYETDAPTSIVVTVSDVYGRVVKALNVGAVAKGSSVLNVPMNDVPPGVYMVTLRTPTAVATTRVQVAR